MNVGKYLTKKYLVLIEYIIFLLFKCFIFNCMYMSFIDSQYIQSDKHDKKKCCVLGDVRLRKIIRYVVGMNLI